MKATFTLILLCYGLLGWTQQIDEYNKLSKYAYQKGAYTLALQHAQKAIALHEAQKNPEVNNLITSLNNLGYAHLGLNQYPQALTTFKQLNTVCFSSFPYPNKEQLYSLHELAKAYAAISLYDSAAYTLENARTLYLSLVEDNSSIEKTNFYELADTYFKINAIDASIHHQLGQTVEAIQILEANKMAIINTYPQSFEPLADYQTTINNLCTYYLAQEQLTKAKIYAQEYLKLASKDQERTPIIHALNNLGSVYRKLLLMDSALFYWRKASTEIEQAQLQNSDLHVSLLNNIGELHFEMGTYELAIDHFKKALAILQDQSYPNPFKKEILDFNLAEAYYLSGQYSQADTAYQLLIATVLNDLKQHFTYLSDREKIAYYNKQQAIIKSFTHFVLEVTALPALQGSEHPYLNPELIGTLYELQLNTKAIILSESKRMRTSILNADDPSLIDHYLLWQSQKNTLANWLMAGNKVNVPELDSLVALVEANEKWLVTRSRKFREGFVIEKLRWQDIQKALAPDEAAIEIIRLADGLAYGALILTQSTEELPIFSLVISKKDKLLEEAPFKAYANAIKFQQQDRYSYGTYWQPIIDSVLSHMPHNKMPESIFLSADGIYNQMNVNTFYDTTQQVYVLDQTAIIPLTNTKEILSPKRQISENGTLNIALFGDIDFSYLNQTTEQYPPLPGTEREVNKIKQIMDNAHWNTYLFTDSSAHEQQLKGLINMQVVHIASHAYFQSAEEGSPFSLTNSLLESGIILANKKENIAEDGVLTAFEASGLALDQTPLVVLSACETGRGTQYHGEGVYGLQRALRVAGAEHLMMSLWKVDDNATQELMTTFYQYWANSGELRAAFVAAQKALRVQYPHPYYWGAFILTGM